MVEDNEIVEAVRDLIERAKTMRDRLDGVISESEDFLKAVRDTRHMMLKRAVVPSRSAPTGQET